MITALNTYRRRGVAPNPLPAAVGGPAAVMTGGCR